jgi:hypothetical protein
MSLLGVVERNPAYARLIDRDLDHQPDFGRRRDRNLVQSFPADRRALRHRAPPAGLPHIDMVRSHSLPMTDILFQENDVAFDRAPQPQSNVLPIA